MKPTQGPSFIQMLVYDIKAQRLGIFSVILGIVAIGLGLYGLLNKSFNLTGEIFLLIFSFGLAVGLTWRFRFLQKVYDNGETIRTVLKNVTKNGDEISFQGFYIYHETLHNFFTTIQRNKRTKSLKEDDQIFLVIDRDNPRQAYIQDLYTPDSPDKLRQPIDKALTSEISLFLESAGEVEEMLNSKKKPARRRSKILDFVGGAGIILSLIGSLTVMTGNDLRNEMERIAGAQTLPEFVVTEKEGTDLLLTGMLGGQTPVGKGVLDDKARQMGLIIYAVEVWQVIERDAGWGGETHESSWFTDHVVLPAEITLDGKQISILPAGNLYLDQEQLVSDVLIAGSGESSDEIQPGSLRLVGYRPDAQVTLFGKRGPMAVMVVERVFGGSREELLTDLESQGNPNTGITIGWGMIVAGIVLVGVFLFLRQRPASNN